MLMPETSLAIEAFRKCLRSELRHRKAELELNRAVIKVPNDDLEYYVKETDTMKDRLEFTQLAKRIERMEVEDLKSIELAIARRRDEAKKKVKK